MIKEPDSMEELIYFTQRNLGDKGKVKAWVYKQKCAECGNALMGKPVDAKTGKVKIRAKEYVCPACGNSVEKKEHEETLTCEIKYECPHCGNKAETAVPFKRKKIQLINPETGKKKAVDAIRFQCSKCNGNIDITKKMK